MKKAVAVMLLSPLLAFPWMTACLLVGDRLFGESLVTFYVRHEQRLLWDTFWADFATALPVMYLVVGAPIVGVLAFSKLRGRGVRPLPVLALYAAIGWSAAWYATGQVAGASHVAMAVAGLATALPIALSVSRLTAHGGSA